MSTYLAAKIIGAPAKQPGWWISSGKKKSRWRFSEKSKG
jgi:hypothetical protein